MHLARELVERLALARAAEDHVQRDVVRGERAAGGGGVRRLRVVDEANAVALGDELEPVLDAGERAQRLGDRLVGEPGGARGGGRGGSVLAVVRAGQARFGRQLVGRRELDAPRPRPAPSSKPRGTTAVSSAVWFSKMRSFASR